MALTADLRERGRKGDWRGARVALDRARASGLKLDAVAYTVAMNAAAK
jgi:hypothetical protein